MPPGWTDAPLDASRPAPGLVHLRANDGGLLAMLGVFPGSLVGVPSETFPSTQAFLITSFGAADPRYEVLSGVRQFRAAAGPGYYLIRRLKEPTASGHQLQMQAFVELDSWLLSVMADANDEATLQRLLALVSEGRFAHGDFVRR